MTRLASASKSIYGVPSTVTPPKSSLPLLKSLSDGYNSLTALPLSYPTHKASPDKVNVAGWVLIGPSATNLSSMYSLVVRTNNLNHYPENRLFQRFAHSLA